MTLPDTLLARLIQTIKGNALSGDFLMLGRQSWVGTRKGRAAELFAEVMAEYLPDYTEKDLQNPNDVYCEKFFEILGFEKVDSLDFSDFEGANIIQDLGKPIDPKLHGKYDVVYDGGTCEHVFNLPMAYENAHNLLKPGGVFIGHSPTNNWINHAFYQISPETVFSYWEKTKGYTVLELSLQPLLPNFARKVAHTTNPNKTGKRPRILGELPKNSPIIMMFTVRKPMKDTEKVETHQIDYSNKWDH